MLNIHKKRKSPFHCRKFTSEMSKETAQHISSTKISSKPVHISVLDMSREDAHLIEKYGANVFAFSLELEAMTFPSNFLSRHSLKSESRTKMVDWMIKIFNSYASEPGTFFLCVNILDEYLLRTSYHLYDEDIHLIGMVCVFIASKMEDISPLKMTNIKTDIGHDKFSEKTILRKEREILKVIDFNLVSIHTYDFIRIFLYDLCINNTQKIKFYKIEEHIRTIEKISIYLAKMVALDETYDKYRHSLKALTCIVIAFDILRSHSKTLDKEKEIFIREWIIFIIKQSGYTEKNVENLYKKVVQFYKNIDKYSDITPCLGKCIASELK